MRKVYGHKCNVQNLLQVKGYCHNNVCLRISVYFLHHLHMQKKLELYKICLLTD